MPAPDSLSAALALATAQMKSLASGDLDGYTHSLDAYEAICAALPGELSPADVERLKELLALDAGVAAELRRAKDDLARQMGYLQHGRTATSAYLAAPASRRQPLFEG